jgi:hypothetical protein
VDGPELILTKGNRPYHLRVGDEIELNFYFRQNWTHSDENLEA